MQLMSQEVTLTISTTSVSLSKPTIDSDNFLICVVNVVSDSAIDLSYISDPTLHSQLLPLIQKYSPCKIKNFPVEMKILLTDNVSICSSPYRLLQAEKKLSKLKSQNTSIRELFDEVLLIFPLL